MRLWVEMLATYARSGPNSQSMLADLIATDAAMHFALERHYLTDNANVVAT